MRKLITTLCICIFSISYSSFAQSMLTHEKKVYQAEDKKIYWNKNLPVYIRLAASPEENSPAYQLKSDTSAKYADPYYFDTEGANFIRTRWAVNKETKRTIEPKIEVLWEVYVDGIAPISKIDVSSDLIAMVKGQKYSGKNVNTKLSAKDRISGVDKIYYSINGAEYKEYSSPIQLTEEGEYVLKYYAVDRVGNAEEPRSEKFFLDLSAPNTEHTLSGNFIDNTLSGNAKIVLNVKDQYSGVSKIIYTIDNKEKTYTSPIVISNLSEGEHTIKYHSVDRVKNKETEKEFTFYIDKTAPMVSADIIGDRYNANGKEYFSGRAKVKLIAIDNKAGVKDIFYSINGANFQQYDAPFYLTVNGNTNIDYYAVDKVGNKSVSKLSNDEKGTMSYLDLTGPQLSHNFIGSTFKTRDTVFINSGTKVQLKATDMEAGLQKITYSINGGEEKEYSGPFNIEKEGSYKLEFVGLDNVNNTNKQTITFVVDNDGPSIFPTFDGKSLFSKTVEGSACDVYPSHVALFLSVTDKQLGYDKIYYSINGGPETIYTNPIHGFNKGKDYKIKVKALDKLGNISYESVAFAIAD